MHFLAQPHMFMHLVDDLVPAYLVVTIYEFMHQLLVVELYLMIHVPGLKLFIFRSYLICCLVKSCFEMHDSFPAPAHDQL